MSKLYCPFLYGKFRKFFRIAALAASLSAAACAGSSEQSDEVVESSDVSSEETASADDGSGLIIEQESADDTGNDIAQLSQDSATDEEMTAPSVDAESQDMASEEPTSEMSEASDTDAVPQDIMAAEPVVEQETPESIDATLDSALASDSGMTETAPEADTSVMDAAVAAQPVMDTESGLSFEEPASVASTSTFGDASGVLPPGVIASPGAAIFIQSKYEKPSTKTASVAAKGAHTYVVKPGDTVSGIARKLYGSFAKTKALASMNGIAAPYIIRPGDVLKFDPSGASTKGSHATASGSFKVKSGDTLSKIAGEVFGNPGAWKKIYDLNKSKIDNPNIIRVGMVLSLDGASKSFHAAKPAKKPAVAKQAVKAEPKVETPVPVAAPVEDVEVPVAQTVEEPALDEEAAESINVDLPADEEE